MPKPHVIFIHGMGEHEKEDFLEDFFTPLDKAAEHFGSLGPLTESVVPHYIDYNELMNDIRKFMGKASVDELQEKFSNASSIVSKIDELNKKFAEDDSFWFTHVLDVAIYRSYFADGIQARVGRRLLEAMETATKEHADIHIVCHSLGTWVGHDVLHKLYTDSLRDGEEEILLSAELNEISSVTMVANVCDLPFTTIKANESVVKPGPNGICKYLISCRHVLDPFASIFKFEPESHWPEVQGGMFRNIVTRGVERANVHDFDHYFADPKVFLPFFINLFPLTFVTNSSELKAAEDAHKETTVQGKFDTLKKEVEDAKISLYWDDDKGEFVFSEDADSLLEKLSEFLDQLKRVKNEINTLTE